MIIFKDNSVHLEPQEVDDVYYALRDFSESTQFQLFGITKQDIILNLIDQLGTIID